MSKRIDSKLQKIDELNRKAWDIRINDSNAAFQLGKEAVELSKKINYERGIAEGLRIEGFAFIRTADYEKAFDCLQEALTIFQNQNDLHGLATVNEYLGIVYRTRGNGATALEYIFKALELSQQSGFAEAEITILYQIGVTYRQFANYEKALDYLYQSLLLARSVHFTLMEAYDLNVIGSIYFETGEYNKALEYFMPGLVIRESSGDKWGEAGSLDNIGFTYLKLKNYSEASVYCTKSLEITKLTGDKKGHANTLLHLAEAYKQSGFTEKSSACGLESLQLRQLSGDKKGEAEILLFLSDLETQTSDTIFGLLEKALKIAEEIKATDLCSKIRLRLYEYYKKGKQFKQAIEQLELHIELEKELHKNTITQKIQNLEISYKAEETKKEAEAMQHRNKELTALNEEIKTQKLKVEITLAELRSAQAQLIQSEKMASLGELTAGIAHEIQNPLNFVNNFSELNKELAAELQTELKAGNAEEAIAISNDIKANEEKINHHGRRADAIVKGMLQHSRVSSGQKELTDINTLADEYLRLTYHGMRAKDKNFIAEIKMDFDNSVGKVNIVPQDIERVLLNLYNNAFYAASEKRKIIGENFKPLVSVQTKKLNNNLEIVVTDNGIGIPQNIVDKIFQPFFTTKPTGQGTGLGLSLAYDIIKAHGGELKVVAKEGEGSQFVIFLPGNIIS